MNQVGHGPLLSQGGPLAGLIPQGAPPVPARDSTGPVSALSGLKYVAFGDSITYGTLSSYDGAFVYDVPTHSYGVRLELALDTYHQPQNFTVVNSGVPGEWATDGALRIQAVITTQRPQGLLLLEGINDLSTLGSAGISPTINAIRQIIDTARANNVTVLVGNMFQTYDTTNPDTGEMRTNAKELIVPFNAALAQLVATRQNVYIVDLYSSLGTNHTYVGADGLHPTEQGYERLAQRFLSEIETRFSIRGSVQ